jgi:transglutaminase-like putative cysteine protease
MREAEDAGVSRCEGLGTAGWGKLGGLRSTPDANTTDPFILAQAAALGHDPERIFVYVREQMGYEAYRGSLRGARGTLWSKAGNALDQASLLLALLRASGIPARCAQGTLPGSLAQQLLLSMFPASFQRVGFLPAGTPVSDPAMTRSG